MKKVFVLSWMVMVMGAYVLANEAALVYENENAVLTKNPFIGSLMGAGILVSADTLPAGKKEFVAGALGGPLHSASLIRIDLQLNTAYLSLGDVISSASVQDAHSKKSMAVKLFLPEITSMSSSGPDIQATAPDSPLQILINGERPGQQAIHLKKRLKKAKFTLDVVNISSVPVWNVSVELISEPKLSFWKAGRKTGMTEIPQTKFEYAQQIFFKPMNNGASIKIPVEVFFIENDSYVWSFNVKAKGLSLDQKVQIQFD